ncbi:MAG TPA: DUF1572 family protein [Bryobacteraceae bacterium]|jgi:uncharacterized damage-inducible protein DinB|nr:DUF1572 family protein [Bryobacteraceae bacterium]
MSETVDQIFLRASAKNLEQLWSRIRDCLAKLSTDEIWARGHENENAIGNLVLHLNGNVRQWIISGVGGAPDSRVRDAEFAARGGVEIAELRDRLDATVREAIAVIGKVTPQRITERLTIQKYEVTVLEAIYHVVEHFGQHTGQIIFVTKMLTGEDLGFYKHLRAAVHAEKTP